MSCDICASQSRNGAIRRDDCQVEEILDWSEVGEGESSISPSRRRLTHEAKGIQGGGQGDDESIG